MPNRIESIKEGRVDLTKYLIHFTRSSDGLTAFNVLKKIISDGYLACGWSQRSRRRTIFGTKPAVCFSETPLCGFLDYAAKRRDPGIMSSYGIFLQKKQFFNAGGRPVIYGMTKDPVEEFKEDGEGLILGLSESEQYRYILTTSIDGQNDWTHEREWRWANWLGYSDADSIFPLWKIGQLKPLLNVNFNFWPIGIIVKNESELEMLKGVLAQNYIKEQEDYKKNGDNFWEEHRLFSLSAIEATMFVVLNNFTEEQKKTFTIESLLKEKKLIRMRDHLILLGLVSDPKV